MKPSRSSTAIRWLALSIALLASASLLWPSPSRSASLSDDRYDDTIKAAVLTWWPTYPFWTAWKAQLYQESRLDPNAESTAGAVGLAQFMPGTWADVARAMRFGGVDRRVAEPAILGGAYYMAQLRKSWSSPRSDGERHRLAQASYNAGLGNIMRAQRACGGVLAWGGILRCLPQVTGPRNAAETITYVERIARWREILEMN